MYNFTTLKEWTKWRKMKIFSKNGLNVFLPRHKIKQRFFERKEKWFTTNTTILATPVTGRLIRSAPVGSLCCDSQRILDHFRTPGTEIPGVFLCPDPWNFEFDRTKVIHTFLACSSMAEPAPVKRLVAGSNPAVPVLKASVAQVGRAAGRHPAGCRFEACLSL